MNSRQVVLESGRVVSVIGPVSVISNRRQPERLLMKIKKDRPSRQPIARMIFSRSNGWRVVAS